jgi:hypothetical protein
MSHLPTERLAALVDEAPSAGELAHLASCAECARERAQFQSLAELASTEYARIGTPLTNWDTLATALVADGVIDAGRGSRVRSSRMGRPWLQAAAALLFVAGGTMVGRYSAGASPLPLAALRGSSPASAAADSAPQFSSVDQARSALASSQIVYQTAAAYLAERDTASRATDTPRAMRTRLAALDRANEAYGAALSQAPYDPVINGYYLSTLGQREATIRQLNTAMPATMRMISY